MTTEQSRPAIAITGLRKPHPKSGYGLGLFALDEGPNCSGTSSATTAASRAPGR